MQFVRLETAKKGTVFINPEHVVSVEPTNNGQTEVHLTSTHYIVAAEASSVVKELAI